jgi:hypothetical protein
VVERRIRARASGGASVSDASVDTFREQVSVLRDKPVRFPDGSDSITVDTSKDEPVRIGRVLQELIKIGQLTPGIGA